VQRLFGIPMGGLALALALALGLVVGGVATLAIRHRVLLRLGLRNVARRRGRALLIVTGLMLGTTIISSALVTGDTMSRTVRSSVIESLGQTDELVSVRGAELTPMLASEQATRIEYLSARDLPAVERALRRTGLVDGVAPAIIEPVALQDLTSRQTESRVSLFAADPARMAGFGDIRTTSGGVVSLAELRDGEVYLNRDAADELDARAGDSARMLAGARNAQLRVAAIVEIDGAGTDGPAMLLPLARAQELLGRPAQIRHVLVSNNGDETSGSELTDAVVRAAAPSLAPRGLELQKAKQEGLASADQVGDVFISVFTTFGSFSIVAGVLLIFLIFVTLSAERRSELGIARAVGTRREHLVQMFVFEGLAYDLGAAAVGAALGVGVAFGMVSVMAQAFSSAGLEIRHAVSLRSVVVAYALGVLLTFAVVAISAWRVSVLNIVAAVRGLPEPPTRRGRRRIGLGAAGLVAGVLMAASGHGAGQATPFSLGLSLAIISLVPLVRAAGAGERLAYSGAGAVLLVWWLLPFDALSAIAGRELGMDFSAWIVSGLMVVAGATWLIVYNADLLLGLAMRMLGRIRSLAPMLKMAMAYPLRVRFRTGVTLAMFTIVVGATTSRAFLRAVDDVESFGGGFDVRAQIAPESPLGDPNAAIRAARGLDARDFRIVAGQSVLPAKLRQPGAGGFETYPVRGFDHAFLTTTTYGLAARARGYESARAVWDALDRRSDLAVIDPLAAPRRNNWNFGPPPAFQLHGFAIEDKTFDPVEVIARDPQSGRRRSVTVIGVLADTTPQDMAGVWTSDRTAAELFGSRAAPTIFHAALAPGVDPDDAARRLERAFIANGMEAESTRKVLHDAIGASYTLNWLLLGFMGLGLIVGVRRARGDQRALGGRAPPADRRAALDRLPPPDGAAQLPARVVVHRADRDRRRHRARARDRLERHPGLRRPALVAGRAAHRRALDAPRHRVPDRLCSSAADHVRAGGARVARLSRRSAALRVERRPMTFIWFVIWLIANNAGGHEPLAISPVNAWAGTLILAIALDLSASHARGRT
jgi:putative ABC transport system permease protein